MAVVVSVPQSGKALHEQPTVLTPNTAGKLARMDAIMCTIYIQSYVFIPVNNGAV
jgi:hypothetical protein